MREHNKRWLLSVMKTSGSKRKYVDNGRFADERNTKIYQDLENLPQHESIGSTRKFYGKMNIGLLVRFLRGQVGNDWDEVYSEIIARIPTKLLPHKDIVYRLVADKIKLVDGKLYNAETNKFLITPEVEFSNSYDFHEFYVHPETNLLMRTDDRPSKRQTKNLSTAQRREFREQQHKQRVMDKNHQTQAYVEEEAVVRTILTEHNKQKKVLPD